MCGICGLINLDPTRRIEPSHLKLMNSTLRHRGPDDEGIFIDKNVGMAMRRLSIIDVEGGKQPISNEDKSVWIVFNGEIYNYKEIRKMLLDKGHIFTTNSDTESIVHLYEEVGTDFAHYLRGMFAISIWDYNKNQLILVRDRMGIKPLFYGEYNGQVFFASEMKAILAKKEFPRELDYNALAAYFTLAYIPAPLTIYKHIHKLSPGHMLTVKNNTVQIRKYWDIQFAPDRSKSTDYFINTFLEILEESVKLRLRSDVPLGAFLSGGIDSGIIVSNMSKLMSEPAQTFCIGFGGNTGGYLDERNYAKKVSSKYKTSHSEYLVNPSPHDIISNIITSFDEPFADHSTIPTYYLCKTVRKNVTVALSGLGGDELFGGYERYLGLKLTSFYNKFPHFLRENIIRKLIEKIPERQDGHYTVNHLKRFVRSASLPQDIGYFGFLSMLNQSKNNTLFSEHDKYTDNFLFCQQMLINHFNASNATDPLDRAFYCDIKTYLPEDILACTDRISMHHSLEVRVPFLDHKLMEFCATIPNEMKIRNFEKKYILKKACSNLLPKEVISHRKQGFVGPMTSWLQNDLKTYVKEILSDNNLDKHGILNKQTVKTICDEHFHRKEINDKLIWSLIVFQSWYNLYLEEA